MEEDTFNIEELSRDGITHANPKALFVPHKYVLPEKGIFSITHLLDDLGFEKLQFVHCPFFLISEAPFSQAVI
jgi:hypothetical protein